jgi:Cupin-like domain
MLAIDTPVRTVEGARADALPEAVLASSEPLLLRGLVADWPLVGAARQSAEAADRYLRAFYRDATVGAFFGPPEIEGRIFYNDDMSGFNYQAAKVKLDVVLDGIQRHLSDPRPPAFYVGSTTVDTCLPGFRDENDIDLGELRPLASIWLGNQTRVAAHYDVPDNIACCAAGHRRFILFPPSELENLYVGPLDFTPAGQPISLVDFRRPDFERFPRFRQALANARLAELEPGDALFIPSMWWHYAEALDGFNVLVNYWWRRTPEFMGQPVNVLNHALLSLRDLPAAQRKAWQDIFRFYVFEFDERSVAHIPEARRGILSSLDDTTSRKIRAQLLSKLNR